MILRKLTVFLLMSAFFLSAEELRFFSDYAGFYDPEQSFVELYFMFPRGEMARQQTSAGLQGKYLAAINIYREDKKIFSSSFAVDDVLEPGEAVPQHAYIPKLLSLHLPPGDYRMHTVLRDFYSGRTAEQTRSVRVRSYSGASLELSDIQIASYVAKTSTPGSFTKLGDLDVIPMANPEFDAGNGIFHTYFEIYRLAPGAVYTVQSRIRDLNGKVLLENAPVESRAPGAFDAVVDQMDIRNLPAGTYEYQVLIRLPGSGQEAEAVKRIYFIRETDPALLSVLDFEENVQEELDSMFQVLKPLMSYKEMKDYRNASLRAKRLFFRDFWRRRDPDLQTALNEYYYEILERVQYADRHFGGFEKGARSDRGRVLLKYGYPSEIRRSGAGAVTKDYEIWHYEGLRGEILFVFCDTRGRGFYELIHSDMEGEIYNANWQAVIQSGAKSY
ncbi:MAG: GWxTD domain-containing protein [Candidatus Neomarinimicrobiota bacterium]|jgi:GWxTD domain-containing protein|nr:GWxTD domain-containing protein [Candidatus Neomarinimicrobiota bacterium]MDD3966279.1 GWxTD domain-containing protein [Candidatus Neomarinimicrobiota bacterium]MDX9779753.1 GWxTD domain-containing protein [bacterium]